MINSPLSPSSRPLLDVNRGTLENGRVTSAGTPAKDLPSIPAAGPRTHWAYAPVRLLLSAAVVAGLLLLALMAAEERLFIPGGRDVYPVLPPIVHQEIDIPVGAAGNGEWVNAWYVPYEGSIPPLFPEGRPFVLYCHGNAKTLTKHVKYTRGWASELGADYVIFDYRGFGKSPGLASEQSMYADARAVYDWAVKVKKVDPRRIVIAGNSLGGAVAAQLSTEVPCRALILHDTFTSAPAAAAYIYPFIPTNAVMRDRFPTIGRLPTLRCPVMIFGGAKDDVVPPKFSEQLYLAAREPKQLFISPERGHFDPLAPPEFARIRSFLRPQE